jgi:hypothetical protein
MKVWSQGRVVLMKRGTLLLVASFALGSFSAGLPEGPWRVLLDSEKAQLVGRELRGQGHHAVVLEQG